VIVASAVDRGRFAPKPITELDNVDPPQWLLRNELVRGYNFLYGPSGSGKTFYAIDLAGRVATSIGTVVYVPTEDVGGLRIRTTAWRIAHDKQLPNFHWINATREQIDLTNARDVDDLIAALRPLAPKLTIIDTLAMAHTGDENNETYSSVNRSIQRIMAEVGTYILLVHHTGVNEGRERGGTALMGNVDIKLKVSNDDGLIRIQNEKIRNGIDPDPMVMRLTSVNTGIKDDDGNDIMSAIIRPASTVTMRGAALTTQQKALLTALALEVFAEAGAKGSQLMANVTALAPSSFYRTISTLMSKGFVRQNKKGDPFYITDKGRDELAPEYLEAPDPGYTPVGYDGDSQNGVALPNAQLSNSHGLSSDSHGSYESPSSTHTNSTFPTPTHLSVGVRESCESDRKEEPELFDDEPATAPASSEPRNTIDPDFVRKMLAIKDLVAIQRHCSMNWFNGIRPAPVELVIEYADPQPADLE
jgi:predicted transcriptional regulator